MIKPEFVERLNSSVSNLILNRFVPSFQNNKIHLMAILINFENKLNFYQKKKNLPNTTCWFKSNNKTGFLVILPNYQNYQKDALGNLHKPWFVFINTVRDG